VTLALKDIRLPVSQRFSSGITVLPVPLTLQTAAINKSPVNYADMLSVAGFSDSQDVAARLNAWRGILTLVQPDMLVADHAPTALLAACLGNIPYLSIGNGFVIPPDVFPWPSIRPWDTVSDQMLLSAESNLNKVTDAAQKTLGYAHAVSVRELFQAPNILDTFSELDHYGVRTQGNYVGPIVSVPQALQVNWQSREGSKILVYLRPAVPGFSIILQALAQLDAEVLCIVPGMNAESAKSCATNRMRISLVPVDLIPLLEHADLAIGSGNSGFSTLALLAGVPLLMRPTHIEQALFAQRVEALGAGKLLSGRINVFSVTELLRELLSNAVYRQAARVFQECHAQFSPAQAIEESISLIERVFLDSWNSKHTPKTQELSQRPSV
jgi:UDP:flavonoid glycosyltransferase YjiC (YdhE family)